MHILLNSVEMVTSESGNVLVSPSHNTLTIVLCLHAGIHLSLYTTQYCLFMDLQITSGFQGCKYFGCTNTYTFSTSIVLYIFWSDSALFQLCWFLSQGNLRIIRWFNVRQVRCIYCVEKVPLWVVSLAYIMTLPSEIWPRGRDRSGVPLIIVQSTDLEI